MANNISRIFNSAFAKRLSNSADDAVKTLRKNKNFKKLEPGVKNIVNRKTAQNTANNIIDSIPNKSDDFAKKFGKRFTKNSDGIFDTVENINNADLANQIGSIREAMAEARVSAPKVTTQKQNSDQLLESLTKQTSGLRGQRQYNLNKKELQNQLEDKVKQEAINKGSKGMPGRNSSNVGNGTTYIPNKNNSVGAKNSPSGGNSSAKKKDPKADNWVYKAAAAGVGGGLVLSMSNSRGQQTNQQLYGQGGY